MGQPEEVEGRRGGLLGGRGGAVLQKGGGVQR